MLKMKKILFGQPGRSGDRRGGEAFLSASASTENGFNVNKIFTFSKEILSAADITANAT